MKLKKYLNQFIILSVWIICVLLLFKFIPQKQVAAVIAGVGFIFFPMLFLRNEIQQSPKRISHIFVLILFLLISAVPIFLLRVLNWGVDFNSLSLFGVPASKFHGLSNGVYFLMMASCLFQYFRKK